MEENIEMEIVNLASGLGALCATAVGLGFTHTILGPDHYVPFLAMSRANGWSFTKTLIITVLCGVGHILGSVAIGVFGIALGIALFKLETIEGMRGDVAGWLLLAFGLAYFVWGVRNAIRNIPHAHMHVHEDGTVHRHEHVHTDAHAHVHTLPHAKGNKDKSEASLTPWILFLIFVFGPCEPLIPLLMYPAAKGNALGVTLVALVFGVVTIATMTTIVVLGYLGSTKFILGRFHRYGHALAGFLVVACGAAILLGL